MGYRKLGRLKGHRQAMLRNALVSFFRYERIQTTEAKAKELRRQAEELITLAKRGDLHARRQAAVLLPDKEVLKNYLIQWDHAMPIVLAGTHGFTSSGRAR